ncbi:MAG: helix-turn-helix domain-containing protein [Alphaproteobacteria bacterium]|jgi:DNA-binding response OmpR family regulator|nr:helix-turn-helix domain-containing protein [Candidatus Jidaibacter sp.]
MLKALIISDKTFLQDALSGCAAYTDTVCFVTSNTHLPDYDLYISDKSEVLDNVISVKQSEDGIVISQIIAELDRVIHKLQNIMEYKDLKLKLAVKAIALNLIELDLTSVETQILKILMLNVNSSVSREYLLNHILGYTNDSETKALENHIYKLRKKLDSLQSKVVIVKTDSGYKIT